MLRSLMLFAALGMTTLVAAEPYNAIFQACGLDAPGGDIGSVTSDNPDACPFQCAATNGCTRVTWTNYQGGTCWLKASGLDLVPNAGAITYHLLVDKPAYEYPDAQGFVHVWYRDMPGFDIGSRRGADIDECVGWCGLVNSCWAVVWTDYEGGTCWLKSRGSAYAYNAGAKSVVMNRKLTTAYGRCKPL